MELIESLPAKQKKNFLELGCGDGAILERLSTAGLNARGTTFLRKSDDYIRTREYPDYVSVDEGIDLEYPLPYPDESVDVIYSTEVIEHIEAHANFISESARVLKEGGSIIFTTPNINRVISRLSFLLTGIHLVKNPMPDYKAPLARKGEFHIRCVDFSFFHWAMWVSGLRIVEIKYNYSHSISKLAIPVIPLTKILCRRSLRRYGENFSSTEAREDLVNWMSTSAMMFGENICVHAQKITANG